MSKVFPPTVSASKIISYSLCFKFMFPKIINIRRDWVTFLYKDRYKQFFKTKYFKLKIFQVSFIYIFEKTILMKNITLLFLLTLHQTVFSGINQENGNENIKHVLFTEWTTWVILNVNSVNFEYCVFRKPGKTIAPRIGLGYFYGWEGKGPTVPVSINGIFGENSLKWEINAGINLFYSANEYSSNINNYSYTGKKGNFWSPLWALPIARAGLRYEKNNLVFKGNIGVCGLGCAIGYKF